MDHGLGTSITVARLEKGDVVERAYLDPAQWEFVVEVRRVDGSITEERVGLLYGLAGGSMKSG